MAVERKGALIAGLILIALGTIFFLQEFYSSIFAWGFVLRYWPVILILIGVKKIYGYFTWREVPPVPHHRSEEGRHVDI